MCLTPRHEQETIDVTDPLTVLALWAVALTITAVLHWREKHAKAKRRALAVRRMERVDAADRHATACRDARGTGAS